MIMRNPIQLIPSKICFALVAVLTFGGAYNAQAATKYWAGAVPATGCKNGGGSWAGANIWRGAASCSGAGDRWDTGQTAVGYIGWSAGQTAGSITGPSTAANVQTLYFQKTGFSISGGLLNLASAPTTIDVGANMTASISSTIAHTASGNGLTKANSGTLTLSGPNTYNGPTTVSAGRLNANTASPNSATGTGAVTVNAGGTLGGNGRISGNVTVANSATAVLYPNNSGGGTLTVGGSLTVNASSLVTFDLSSTYNGANDKVVMDGSGKTLTCGGAQITINSAGTLDTSGNDYVLIDAGSATISGSFNTTPAWSGTTPANSGDYSIQKVGNTIVLHYGAIAQPRTLHWNTADANWTATGAWYDPATSASATYNNTTPDSVVLEDDGRGTSPITITLTTTVSPGSVTMTSSKNFIISGTGGAIGGSTGLGKGGAGTLTLGVANTYVGATTVSAGTLKLGAAGVIPDGATKGSVTVDGTLDLNSYSETINGLSGAGTVDNTAASSTPTLTVGNANADSTWSGIIQNTAGTLAFTKTGTGTLTWNPGATANTYSGDTTIDAGGKVIMGNSDLLPYGANKGNMTINGTLDVQGFTLDVNGLSGSGTITSPQTPAYDNASIIIGHNNGIGSFSGVIDNGTIKKVMSVTKVGTGTQTLLGANTFSGQCDARDGVLEINSIANAGTASAIGKGNYNSAVNNNYAKIGLGATVGGMTTIGTLRYIGGGHSSTRPFVMWGASGGGMIDASGTGALTLSGNITGGLSDAATTKTLTLKGSSLNDNTISGVISDQTSGDKRIAVTKDGGGKWILNNANTYTGGTTITGGTLEVGASGSIQDSVTVNGGVFRLDNASAMQSSGNLTLPASPGAGMVELAFTGTQMIGALVFGSTPQAAGTWGSLSSGAYHKNAAFTGNGLLQIGNNNTPVAQDITLPSVTCGTSARLEIIGGKSPPSDADPGDTLTVYSVQSPTASSGTATITEGGATIVYTAPPSGSSDSFTYTVTDGKSVSAPKTVTVTSLTADSGGYSPNYVTGSASYDNPTHTWTVQFRGIPGVAYGIERQDTLGGSWTRIGTATADSKGLITVTDSSGGSSSYYRTVYP
jgi:fibronectin-binding autotransporter adhesin